MTDLASLAGVSSLVAAVATVVGAITLILFFSKGGAWGLLNDLSSIVLMLATMPVAVAIARYTDKRFEWEDGALAVGVIGMAGASVSQALLVARRFSYQQLLPWTLGFGAIVGVWYILIGLGGITIRTPWSFNDLVSLDALAIVSGISFIALGYGFLRGNERHPLSIAGGVALLVASTWFLTWIGLDLLSGELYLG